jgi:hypothetical protein
VQLALDPVGIVAQLVPHRIGLRCVGDDPQLSGLFFQTRRPFAARDVHIQDHEIPSLDRLTIHEGIGRG